MNKTLIFQINLKYINETLCCFLLTINFTSRSGTSFDQTSQSSITTPNTSLNISTGSFLSPHTPGTPMSLLSPTGSRSQLQTSLNPEAALKLQLPPLSRKRGSARLHISFIFSILLFVVSLNNQKRGLQNMYVVVK